MNFTAEQQRAIDARGVNVLVSAGAGSGKTGVLTERIIDRLRDGEDIDRLLVLTYTKAAAGEMLKRIRQKIFTQLSAAVTKAEREHWQRQIILLGDASITTLHSFCLRLLKRHYNAIPGLAPEFRVLEPSLALVHLHDLLDEFLENCYTQGEAEERERFYSLLRLYGNRLGDDGLKDEILHLREFGCAQGDFYEWLLTALNNYEDTDFWFDHTMAWAKREVTLILQTLEDLRDEAVALNGPSGYILTLKNDIDAFRELLAERWQWSALGGSFFGTLKRKTKDDDEEIANYIKDRRNSVKDYFTQKIQPVFKRSFHVYAQEIEETAQDMATLIKITSEFYKQYQSYKLSKGFLEFSDLEQYAYELLRENQALAWEYQSFFKEVLIDEYQDVNPLQEKILALLTNGHNLFVVGDIKQSIYGFRFADHSIFKARYNKYAQEEGAGLNIILNRNFRSNSHILNTVNYFFSQWLDEQVLDLPYGKDEALISGRAEDSASDASLGPAAELNFIYRPAENELDELFDDPEEIRYHSRYIAKRIEEMLASRATVNDGGNQRPLEYGDIAILLRSVRDAAPIIEDELTLRAIPVAGATKRHFTACQEVRLLLSLLRVLDNPCQDIHLGAVLRSPFFGFDEDELMQVALKQRQSRLWTRLGYYLATEEPSPLYERFKSCYERLNTWRAWSKIYPVADLLSLITRELNYQSFWSGLPGGKNRLRNIDVFMGKAESFQENGGSLFDFLRYVNNLAKTGADEVDDSGDFQNCVKIMSIHKSKGLEFPVVFCPAVEKPFNLRDSTAPLLLHNKLGLGPKYKDSKRRTVSPTLPRLLIKHTINQANMAERLRVLYVAMTRAESKLIFTAAIKSQKKAGELQAKAKYHIGQKLPGDLMLKSSSFLQWLCYGLARKNGSADLPYKDCSLMVSLLPAANPLEKAAGTSAQTTLPLEALERLKKALAVKPREAVKAKVTVTELLPSDSGFNSFVQVAKPRFLGDMQKLTPAERGTVFHRFMELLDYTIAWDEASLRQKLATFVESGVFSQNEADSLDIAGVAAFYQSPYGAELAKARKVKRELAFTALLPAREVLLMDTDDETVVQGAIDLLYCREDNAWVLVDYKTGKLGQDTDEAFLSHYGRQMELYTLALEHLFNIKVGECVFYLSQEKRFLRYK